MRWSVDWNSLHQKNYWTAAPLIYFPIKTVCPYKIFRLSLAMFCTHPCDIDSHNLEQQTRNIQVLEIWRSGTTYQSKNNKIKVSLSCLISEHISSLKTSVDFHFSLQNHFNCLVQKTNLTVLHEEALWLCSKHCERMLCCVKCTYTHRHTWKNIDKPPSSTWRQCGEEIRLHQMHSAVLISMPTNLPQSKKVTLCRNHKKRPFCFRIACWVAFRQTESRSETVWSITFFICS